MASNQNSMRVLVVEDEADIAQNIIDYFENAGHVCDYAMDGKQAIDLALTHYFDVVILDLNLPKVDGLVVCETLRQQANRNIPILMLTARDALEDKINGFNSGTDDYLTKPFSLQELEIRCIALSRRHLLNTNDTLELGPLSINKKSQSVARDGQTIQLHAMGYRILSILADEYPQIVSRSQLCERLWQDEPTESDSLRSHIYQLRNALDKPFEFPLIKTIHSVGFTLDIPEKA